MPRADAGAGTEANPLVGSEVNPFARGLRSLSPPASLLAARRLGSLPLSATES